ncbi:MAG: hypothetical protein HY819_14170 [Acidobacteria bacterium]|nr:hypothetical protein [Acidobacteriota bacterium]
MLENQELDQPVDNKDNKDNKELEDQLGDQTDRIYYENSLRDGYKGLLGAIIGTVIAEIILWFGGIKFNSTIIQSGAGGSILLLDNVPLIFIFIGLMLTLRHIAQIWQAKTQLKQLSLDK